MIWFHGCPKRCPGCLVESERNSNDYESITPELLADWVFANSEIEGITLSGGEPFEQIDQLIQFLEIIRSHSSLSVLSYTGHRLEEIQGNAKGRRSLQLIDVLIDGEYHMEQDFGQRWRGSENQCFHFLSPRYLSEKEEWFAAKGREIEIELKLDGSFWFAGVPTKGFIGNLTKRLNVYGVSLDFS